MDRKDNAFVQFMETVLYVLDAPVEFFREKIVTPNQKKYPWYHQKFRRVPTIDECYELDVLCYAEAQSQYQRDKMVEDEILSILRQRYEDCAWYYGEDKDAYCAELYKHYEIASGAWFAKYGDMGAHANVREAFMKQKHRMIWERRHGPVGSGITNKTYDV
ncbi:NADH dehydrogenase [ubiquinone] 1 beta subcomplex subunit 10 [Habropoda laboriosa]|uniref:NADH dehydrogenase [ubiquinone] 1 beta subcomplex subunit 10 n=1 Tax=Habropoda laboriosa TaxID=597456 RepID=A0A0L7R8R0_9HYME|nr:PREDICTED: NADH dehydrogenase [ubiquinone] 1 beta subcomplex subunit 10 [Habropoda laboriosa]KOC67229.1 NADH dehydrogenase [ubiquinone] 1 beta subcomplex subunit 10 [Habropoda laboriosa]